MPNYSTGPSLLPDVGELSYNGCTFSPLYETNIAGKAIGDEARRTVKYMEYAITADGYVTMPDGQVDIDPTMRTLRRLLTAQAGVLVYRGRGFNLRVNDPDVGGKDARNPVGVKGPGLKDVAWGPIPEVIDFQPLGSGRSAKIKWKVTTRVTEVAGGFLRKLLLQLNYDTTVTYNEDGYSSLSINGTLEMPLTRPAQGIRTLATTVDDFRFAIGEKILEGIDLSRFRVTKREIKISRDKRTMEWNFTAEERPYMDLPPFCIIARGSYNVRPAKAGLGMVRWLCTLKATYTVRADITKRVAWLAFLYLLRLRMSQASQGVIPPVAGGNQNPAPPNFGQGAAQGFLEPFAFLVPDAPPQPPPPPQQQATGRCWLTDFSFDEGLYSDSKTISFSASWRLSTIFSHIFPASGLWKKLLEKNIAGQNLWALSMKDVQGVQSWLPNKLDPALDVIVDFGSTE